MTQDTSGNSDVQYSYGPYGSISITGTTGNTYTYTGREIDGLGLYYYRARYYNPATGRFISEDSIGLAGGINEYVYVGDDPIDFIDPFGLDKQPPNKQLQCAGQAAMKEGISLGTDVLGAIPGEGQALAVAQLGASGVGFVNSLATNDATGAVGNVLGAQTVMVGMAAKSMGVTALKAVPVVGNVLSGFLAARDIYNGYQDYQSCIGGS